MKKLIVLLIFTISFNSFAFAQNNNDETEKASPMEGVDLIRKVLHFDIEGEIYTDVEVAIKSNNPDYYFINKHRAKYMTKNQTH